MTAKSNRTTPPQLCICNISDTSHLEARSDPIIMISRKFLPLMVVMLAIVRSSLEVSYTVGGSSSGWEMGTDLQTWVSNQAFSEGDELAFQYSPGHDVSEVTKEDYDSCQSTSPIQTFTGGSTVIPLSSPGKRYFICSVPGHCSAGMKLEINTLLAGTSPASISTPPKVAPASAPMYDWIAPSGRPILSRLPPSVSFPQSESSSSPLFSDPNHLSEHSENSSAMKLALHPNAAVVLSLFLVIILGM